MDTFLGIGIKWTMLWSDILVFLLLIAIIGLFTLFKGNRHHRESWRKVFATHLGMCTVVILFSYVCIAVIDSIHFRKALPASDSENKTVYYSHHVNSLLDVLLLDMGDRIEKTYSSPFALQSWSKESIILPNGKQTRDYPSLKYAGKHLKSFDGLVKDIWIQSLWALAKGLLFALFFIGIHAYFLHKKKKKLQSSHKPLPWITAWITFAVVMMLFSWFINIGNMYHVLGTDMAGNDTLYNSLKGIRTAILIGTLTTLITMPIAIILGIASGYFKGWVDDVVQYIYTVLMSIPSLLLIAACILLFQIWINLHPDYFELGIQKADMKFLGLCFILGITSWTSLCRLIRAETLKISQLDYIQSAYVFGVSHFSIIKKHIMPNIGHLILIVFVFDFSAFVLIEAVLSYIGVGVDSEMASWGNMIYMAKSELSREPIVWWNLVGVFFLMFVLVLTVNLFADLVRDAFDPKTHLEVAS